MLPLAALAQHRGLAVLAISHLRKKDGAAIYRTMGSLAFVAAARAAWIITKDSENRDRRLLMPLKNNLARDVTGLAFTIESPSHGGQPIIRWSPDPIDISADNVVDIARPRGRPDAERQDAIDWLQQAASLAARARQRNPRRGGCPRNLRDNTPPSVSRASRRSHQSRPISSRPMDVEAARRRSPKFSRR